MKYERVTNLTALSHCCCNVECPKQCDKCYFLKIYNRLAELEDKIESGELIDTTEPFIKVDSSCGKTWYCVCTYMISEGIHEQCATMEEAEAKLKELRGEEE